MADETDLLKEVPLFQFLDECERAALFDRLETVRFRAGETVFSAGDPGDSLFVISAGKVEASLKNHTGEKIALDECLRGGIFGELSLLDQAGRAATVVALEDTEALRLERKDLEAFLKMRPEAAMNLLAAMGKRLRFSADRIRSTATRNANEEAKDRRSVVQKGADWIAEFAGSITFLMIHVAWFGAWIAVNIVNVPGVAHFDPFPFGFLTLTVSLEAIFLSVFVLLSQNRQAAKDRIRSDVEYDTNLKAELEIRHLHEKLDHLNVEVLSRLEKLQRGR